MINDPLKLPKITPEKYIVRAGFEQAYTNANNVLMQAKDSGYVSPFWTQVKNICIKKLGLSKIEHKPQPTQEEASNEPGNIENASASDN